jgi:hypothetical protein
VVLSTTGLVPLEDLSQPGSTCARLPLASRLSPPVFTITLSSSRYLFAGAWTILWSLVVLFVVPDSPQTSHRWFNEEERKILMARSRENMTGAIGPSTFKWAHAKEAATDIKIYLFLCTWILYSRPPGLTR